MEIIYGCPLVVAAVSSPWGFGSASEHEYGGHPDDVYFVSFFCHNSQLFTQEKDSRKTEDGTDPNVTHVKLNGRAESESRKVRATAEYTLYTKKKSKYFHKQYFLFVLFLLNKYVLQLFIIWSIINGSNLYILIALYNKKRIGPGHFYNI